MVIYDPKYSVCEQNDIPLSGALLLEKEAELAQELNIAVHTTPQQSDDEEDRLMLSNGWLTNWKGQH